jgi:hypothetical protein
MLLSDRPKSLSEEQHDEPEKQARVIVIQPRYLEASKVDKQKLPDEFTAACAGCLARLYPFGH